MRLGPTPALIGLVAAIGWGGPAFAQDAEPQPGQEPGDFVEIGEEMGGFEGVRQLNFAAGDGNNQINLAVIAAGETAIGTAAVDQVTDLNPNTILERTYSAKITGDAFAGSRGITAVNVAAGSANNQANLAMIATGLEGRVATTAALEQTRASASQLGEGAGHASSEHHAQIDPTAFQNSRGIIQVSLIGGTGNASANVAVLSMEASANNK